MLPMLMGIETEYAFSASMKDGRPPQVDASMLIQQLVEIVRGHHAWLPDSQSSGLFLANGARFYVDAGDHPEYSTPECSSPREVVCAAAAGAAILEDARRELEERSDHAISISPRNVDYRTGATWGCHESYSHECLPDTVWEELMPHLVTRIVYTGAGGFDARSPSNAFQISPRVPHLRQSISGCSTRARAILHTKDEPLCREDVYRLHLICGEALYSQRASMLKLGTTALVLRLIDAGRKPGGDLGYTQPLTAMRAFSRDTRLGRRATRTGRGLSSALGVQRTLLERVEAELGQSWLPDWAEQTCRDWRMTLDLLEQDPGSTASFLDWTAKHALFDQLRAARGPSTSAITLRNELYELDARYAQLGAGGIAAALEDEGLLEPALIDKAEIERARTHAPAGRAARRGERIRELHSEAARYRCGWDVIVDQREHKVLALPLDAAQTEDWNSPGQDPFHIELDRLEGRRRRYHQLRERVRAGLGSRRAPADDEEPGLPF